MRVFTAILLITIFGGILGFSQNAKPPVKPAADPDIVKISTNLIQIDVSVTDSKGKPVADLKPNEIEIYENGKKQTMTNFLFVSSGRLTGEKPDKSAAIADRNAIPPPPRIPQKLEQHRRTIAIVVDDLNMSFESLQFTRRALKKFVNEQMEDGDVVAILRTQGGVVSLQRFTTDKRILHAAIEKIKYNLLGRGGLSALEPFEQNGVEADPTQTILTLQFVVNGIREMPGRKAIMLFSDGFPLKELVMREVRKLAELANRASVAFYPIDPRGLQVGLLKASDNTRNMTPKMMMDRVNDRRVIMWESQNGPNFLAHETGGFGLFNSNDLNKGMERALADQSYYLIGYVPDEDTFDSLSGKYNKLEVKVLRKGLTTRYRSGFFGVADAKKIQVPFLTNRPTQFGNSRICCSRLLPLATLRLSSIRFLARGARKTFMSALSFISMPRN